MIGYLPKSIEVNGYNYDIRTDYRIVLRIFQAFNDVNLRNNEKVYILLKLLYIDFEKIKKDDYEEAYKKALCFLDGGKDYKNVNNSKKIMDWEQDEQLIFSSINKVANKEIRELEYLHWWTFLGYFSEIGEGSFATVISIRGKKNKGKKLEKYEQEFYMKNKDIIDLKTKYSEEEQAEIDRLNELLG